MGRGCQGFLIGDKTEAKGMFTCWISKRFHGCNGNLHGFSMAIREYSLANRFDEEDDEQSQQDQKDDRTNHDSRNGTGR